MKRKVLAVLFALVMVTTCCSALADVQDIGYVDSDDGGYLSVFCNVLDGYTYKEVTVVAPNGVEIEDGSELLVEALPNDADMPQFYIDVLPAGKYAYVETLNEMRLEDFIECRNDYFIYEGGLYSECVRDDGVIYLKVVDEESSNAMVGTILRGSMVFISVENTATYEHLNDYDVLTAEELIDTVNLTRLYPGDILMNPTAVTCKDDGEE